MGRFGPTGPVEVAGLEHSVAALSWGVLRGALGPSDGSAGAGSNVPSALGVLRHAEIYAAVPVEIEEAFGVLENHVIKQGQLFPVAIAALPFLFDTLRRGSSIDGRISDLIARWVAAARSLEGPLAERMLQLIADHAEVVIRWFGKHDRALAALVVHVPALRELFVAAVEGAERLSPEALLALLEVGAAPGDSILFALTMLDGADSTQTARMAAAAFLGRLGEPTPELHARVDAALPPPAAGALRNFVAGLWTPTIVRPEVAPKLYDAEVVFTGKKLVLVKADNRSVTLPWAGSDLVRGARLRVGLTTHGQPKLALVADRNGNVRVIDF